MADDDAAHPDGAVPDPGPSEATRLLRRAAGGDSADAERLFELLHDQLRALAGRAMSTERADHTLQPTALVGEVWLKLFADDERALVDRAHFMAVAAQAMRQILVDHARARRRLKRGGGWDRVELDGLVAASPSDDALDLIALDEALDELRALSPRQAQVVELRFFCGLDVAATAEALEVSERTAAREWRFARAWLLERMAQE